MAFLTVLLLSACRMASFTSVPGVKLGQYPESLRGTYRFIENKEGVADTSVVLISANEIHMKSSSMKVDILLNDSANSITHLGDFYYLNTMENDSARRYYLIFPFEYNSKYLYVYKINLSSQNLKRMRKCGLKESGRAPGEFIMEDKAFKKFVEKHLKRKDAIKFVRIN